MGLCASGSINGNGVDVGASQDRGGSESSGGGGVSIDDQSGVAAGAVDPAALRNNITCLAAAPCVDGTPTVHLRDLISFHPPAPTTSMEPNGWAVVNLDANFVGGASTDVQSGALLGAQAQVRFTPGNFTWRYGDGTVRTSATGGATWKELRLPEFSPTSTSHMYRQTGTFTVRASATYSAEYRFANQPWQKIPGSLEIPARDFSVFVGEAKTVLVDRDCMANPSGPGC